VVQVVRVVDLLEVLVLAQVMPAAILLQRAMLAVLAEPTVVVK
jgi:hypothetical protein